MMFMRILSVWFAIMFHYLDSLHSFVTKSFFLPPTHSSSLLMNTDLLWSQSMTIVIVNPQRIEGFQRHKIKIHPFSSKFVIFDQFAMVAEKWFLNFKLFDTIQRWHHFVF